MGTLVNVTDLKFDIQDEELVKDDSGLTRVRTQFTHSGVSKKPKHTDSLTSALKPITQPKPRSRVIR